MHKFNITVCIIAKDEEDQIGEALRSVDWVNEKIVVDTGSTDKTVNIAKSNNAKVVHFNVGSFDEWRNKGIEESSGDWILYIDADERITPELKKEILEKISDKKVKYSAYAIPRRNFIFGKEFKYGGEYPDYQIRLLNKEKLKAWKGKLHESPQFDGGLGYLNQPMIHLKHNNIEDMVVKTNKWSEIEAELIYLNGHPKMVGWRFVRIILTEAIDRLIKKQGFRDGVEGVIYSIYQVWSKFLTYAKLWELQLRKEEIK